ncbi:MAG: pentapeptide repeat-containing protein [Bacteroidota bacterium]
MMEQSPTGIPMKPTKFLDKVITLDFQKIFATLSKSALMLSFGRFDMAFVGLFDLANGYKLANDPENLAYNLVISALIDASQLLTEENSSQFNIELENEEDLESHPAYKKFMDELKHLIQNKNYVLEYKHILNPKELPFLEIYKTHFVNYLLLFGITKKRAMLVSNRLPTYFIYALNNEWRSSPEKYGPLHDTLNAPTAAAARRERQWEAYDSYLQREIELPVFGESFSLKDIFIPLRGYHYKVVPRTSGRKKKDDNDPKKVVFWLDAQLSKWLNSNQSKDIIKVLQGGPGSGKSSFTKIWAAKVSARRGIRVLYFPLHHFNILTTIKAAVGEYFKEAADVPINFNPLEENRTGEKILLVFDGLDELVMRGKTAKEAANSFLEELNNFCSLRNAGSPRVKVLLTGRPIAVQEAEQKLRAREGQIIYLLPYYLSEDQAEEYYDQHHILNEDQRHIWWNRFFSFNALPRRNMPEELDNENMDQITTEPLLNYLVALSWQINPDKFNENININEVYEQLIEGVYDREWDNARKHKGLGDLSRDQFVQVLEEIAVCAWQGGDARLTTEPKIEAHIRNRGLENLLKEYKTSAKNGVAKLLTAFYFRKNNKFSIETGDDTFEFTHKSFGEFLAARAIVKLIKSTHQKYVNKDQFSENESNYEILEEWWRVTGQNPLNSDLRQFIINELIIRVADGEPVELWQKTLCFLLREVILHGLPIDRLKKRFNYSEEQRISRNTEETILVALACCARATDILSEIGNPKDILFWLSKLSSSFSNDDFAFKNLNHLNLFEASIPRVNLSQTNLENSNLQNADLSGAHLDAARLQETNLQKANLSIAILDNASIIETNLEEANLKQASLKEANIFAASLQKADLSNVTATRCDFTASNLSGAKLVGAKLARANFTRANCTEADLTAADLQNADLTGVVLTGANLERATLREADFRGADFTNANLKSADLAFADLSSTKGLTYEQLASTKSLYQAKSIPPHLKDRLNLENPKVLNDPSKSAKK